ncbi:universal stress protein [Halosolutus gelatinilyticus]|uniref:universal stress protein n=1 Tax=Halosolutus gelatinilyticus TaxID=2931975 RepID=UPI001FF0E2A6|nr:universal stress protein [Halosolutus gelatinilyticus]
MDDPILVPIDGSDPATAAFDHAIDVAAETDVVLHLLYVANTNEPSLVRLGEQVVDVLEEEGEEIVDEARSRAEDRGVAVVDHVIQGDPRDVIVEYAHTSDVGLVIMGAHGRHGIGEYVLGSTTEHVVTESEMPVLTVRAGEDVRRSYPYGAVLVPTDGSDHAQIALNLGAEVAARTGATLHLLFVYDELPETIDPRSARIPADVEENVKELFAEASETAVQAGVSDVVTAIESGSVPHEIASYADSNAIDLVAMGTHGWSGIDRVLLGSFADRVIRTAPVPVLTCTERTDESNSR